MGPLGGEHLERPPRRGAVLDGLVLGARVRGPTVPAWAKRLAVDYVLESVYWDAGAARLLPRLLRGRTRGPVFVTRRRPGPGKVVSPRDVCPDPGFARLSYGQARALLDEHTAVRGLGTGWDLHEYRHSSLTHLGEQGASLLMLSPVGRVRPAYAAHHPDGRVGNMR